VNIWIDDLRPAPAGWHWVKTSQEALNLLGWAQLLGADIDAVSFDHDLGGDDTSRRVVLWMCEENYWPNTCHVHSQNNVGVEWLRGMIQRYAPEGTLQ